MKIENNQLLPQYLKFKNEYLKKVEEVLDSGWYVLGNEVKVSDGDFRAVRAVGRGKGRGLLDSPGLLAWFAG